jgi:hypothetical protein
LDVPALLEELAEEREILSITIYRHEELETDWSIHLQFVSDSDRAGRSQTGIRLASLLKEYGIVHHSIWREIRSCKSPDRASKKK